MLDKRTNLLLEEDIFQKLALLAEKRNVSVAELIRRAIRKKYKRQFNQLTQKMAQRKSLANKVTAIRQKIRLNQKINYSKLINAGRKY